MAISNDYPKWKYALLLAMLLTATLFAIPNLFGEDPSVQITARNHATLTKTQLLTYLSKENLTPLAINITHTTASTSKALIRFKTESDQMRAKSLIGQHLKKHYTVALNLASRTPTWLLNIGAKPMKLGLDLRGGVHFLLDIDVNTIIDARQKSDLRQMAHAMRLADVHYIAYHNDHRALFFDFSNKDALVKANSVLSSRFTDYLFQVDDTYDHHRLKASFSFAGLGKIKDYAIEQTITTLRNRVNELGVSEAIVQRQGANHISVDLPGIQDTSRAKDLIGKTATLKFLLQDIDHDVEDALHGRPPAGSTLYNYMGRPVLLKDRAILSGNSITFASAVYRNGRPAVNIHLGGGGQSMFNHITSRNIGKPLAVVYIETQTTKKRIGHKAVIKRTKEERIISIATIQSALGANFDITGLRSSEEAANLALLLRSGALPAPVSIIQELTIGPSLGQANIDKGVRSLEIGALLVFVFMAIYYRLFGLVANFSLVLNVIFIVAIMSMINATLTLPGIAGIVLTIGMAVDANVLINERIREELRNKMSPQAAIYAGYERAFSTIVDANVTTLIVALILYALGSGAVKGFAVTLMIGLLCSMITAIFCTRACINLIYGKRHVKHLSIGI